VYLQATAAAHAKLEQFAMVMQVLLAQHTVAMPAVVWLTKCKQQGGNSTVVTVLLQAAS
jgi:hypothetical protein